MAPTMQAVVEARGLTKRFGELTAVDGIDLRIAAIAVRAARRRVIH